MLCWDGVMGGTKIAEKFFSINDSYTFCSIFYIIIGFEKKTIKFQQFLLKNQVVKFYKPYRDRYPHQIRE
jgi:hypothetical protein